MAGGKYQVIIAGFFADAFSKHYRGWVGVNDGHITTIGRDRDIPYKDADEFLEFDSSCLIIPGLIAGHVHCREPGNPYKEDWRTLGLAAAHGGVTTMATEPNYGKGNSVINRQRLEVVKKLAAENCMVDARFWAGACPGNLEHLGEMTSDPLVVGTKVFTTPFDPDLTFPSEDRHEFECLLGYSTEMVAKTGKPGAYHCEDPALFDEEAKTSTRPWAYADWRTEGSETHMARFILDAARRHNTKVRIKHASAEGTIKLAASYPGAVFELTDHHLTFSKHDMASDPRLKMNPPLRCPGSVGYARRAARGDLPGFFVSDLDHAPHRKDAEDGDANPAGAPSLDTHGSLVRSWIVDGMLSPQRASLICSYGQAQSLGLSDRGSIEIAKRADFAVLRVNAGGRRSVGRPMKIYSKCGWTPYTGLQDHVEATIRGGKLLFREGEPVTV